MWKLIFAVLVFVAVGVITSLFSWGRYEVFNINSYSITVGFCMASIFAFIFMSKATFGKSRR